MNTTYLTFPYAEKGFCFFYDELLSDIMKGFFSIYSEVHVSPEEKSGFEYVKIYVHYHSAEICDVVYEDIKFCTDSLVQALKNIVFEKTAYLNNLFPLHAGAVEMNGKAQLFVAPTGTGKSTLIFYLCQNGYRYINDDKVFIDKKNLNVMPYSSPILLRGGGATVLLNYGFAIAGNCKCRETENRIVYVPNSTITNPIPVGNIYFLKRSNNENKLHKIEKTSGAACILQNMMTIPSDLATIARCAYNIAENCYELVYSDMNYVCNVLTKK